MRNILLFQSIRKVMQAEKQAKLKGIPMKIMPVPSQLSSECGMCIELSMDNIPKLTKLLTEKNIIYQYEQI